MSNQLTENETNVAANAVLRHRQNSDLVAKRESLTDELMSLIQRNPHEQSNHLRRNELSKLLGEIEDQLETIRRGL